MGFVIGFAGDKIGIWEVVEDVETASMLRDSWSLLPHDPIKLFMDVLMLVLVLITVVQVPIVIGFSLADTTAGTVFDTVMDCAFAMDMVSVQGIADVDARLRRFESRDVSAGIL